MTTESDALRWPDGRDTYATLCAAAPLPPTTGAETISHSARGPGWATGVVGVVGAAGVGFDGADTSSLHATMSSDSRIEYFMVGKRDLRVKASSWNTTFSLAGRQRCGSRPGAPRRFGGSERPFSGAMPADRVSASHPRIAGPRSPRRRRTRATSGAVCLSRKSMPVNGWGGIRTHVTVLP